MKKLRLHRSPLSKDAITAIAQDTLQSRGFNPAEVAAQGPKMGDRMHDGTIFAGISPETGEPMYAAPADAPLTMTFNEAADYAKKLNCEKYLGHDDWRLPTTTELNVLFNNRVAIGGFNRDDFTVRYHWSATEYDEEHASGQRFSDGYVDPDHFKGFYDYVRCVRQGSPP